MVFCVVSPSPVYIIDQFIFQAEKLNTYRFCDNVWTFMLKEVEFRENSELAKVDRVKIVACDAKSSVPAKTEAE